MLVVTAGSKAFNEKAKSYDVTVRFCEKKCKEFGYDIKIFDLGGLGFGTFVDDPRNGHEWKEFRYAIKPELILRSLDETEEETVAWIDGDATLIDRIDELDADASWDVAVTVRPRRDRRYTVNINAGVMFFKNNEPARKFLRDWITALGPPQLDATENPGNVYCDQTVIEGQFLRPAIPGSLYDHVGEVHMVNGARVKLVEALHYNNWWVHRMTEPDKSMLSPEIKILHFKSSKPRYRADRRVQWEGEEMSILDVYDR